MLDIGAVQVLKFLRRKGGIKIENEKRLAELEQESLARVVQKSMKKNAEEIWPVICPFIGKRGMNV